jgi:hypothetical protein
LLPPSSGSMQSKTLIFLEMQASSSAMSITIHQTTWCHIPEHLNLSLVWPVLYGTQLKFVTISFIYLCTRWKFFQNYETVPTLCSSPSMSKNVSPTEKKLSTTDKISGNTEFTHVIIKFQEKTCLQLVLLSQHVQKCKSNRKETGYNWTYSCDYRIYKCKVNHTVIGHLIVIHQWGYIILW